MRHSTTAVTCFLLLTGCGGAPEGSDPSAPDQTGQVSQDLIASLGPFDPRFSYQGQFQREDCVNLFVTDDVSNDAWPSGMSCPATSPIPEGRALMPETGCGGTQYLCEQQAFSFANSLKFGGMFQIDDCNTNTIGNTFNNGFASCPRSFFQDRIGRVKAPESRCGATQYLCDARPNEAGGHTFMSGTDLGLNTLRWGGQFQLDDCRGDNRVNPLTGSFSCPSGYTPIQYGRVLGPESGCGVNQSVCVGMEPH